MNRIQVLAFAAALLSGSPAFAHGFSHGSLMGGANSVNNMNMIKTNKNNANMLRPDSNLLRLNDRNQHDADRNSRDGRTNQISNLNRQIIMFQKRENELQNRLNQAQMNGNLRLASHVQMELNRFLAENQRLLRIIRRFGGLL